MRMRRAGLSALALLGWLCAQGGAEQTLVVWGVRRTDDMRRMIREFERRNPGVQVVTASTGGGMDEQKLMCGIAGGSPPDVIRQDRFSVGGWAAREAFLPLDDLIERDRDRPDAIQEADFYTACWQEACYEGKVYAIPNSTDDRALYYNEDLLRRAGITEPPKTWTDLKEDAVSLTRRDASGNMTQVGFIPNYGNSWLYIYGWLNGGEFMSRDGRTCTLNDPRIVEALTYVSEVYTAVGGVEITDSFAASFQTGQLDPFLTGKVAMKIDGNWALGNIAIYAPDLNFGVVPAPAPEGKSSITWSGGFSWAIPRGAKNVDLAWQFIRWMSSPEAWLLGHEEMYRYARSRGRPYVPDMCANRKINELLFEKYAPNHPRLRTCLRTFMDLMEVSKFRPVTPAGQLLWDEHALAMDLAIHDKQTPQAALDRGTIAVQKQLHAIYRPPPPLLDKRLPVGIVTCLIVGGLVWFVRGWRRYEKQCRSVSTRQENLFGYLFAGPWILGFLVFTGGPFIASIVLGFCDYDSLHPVRWVGLSNYTDLFKDPRFWKSMGNTGFMLIGVPLNMALGLGVAMLLNSKVRGMQFYRTVYYLPAIVPFVASSILWIWVLNPQHGLVNNLLRKVLDPINNSILFPYFHTALTVPLWLQDEVWSKPSIILMGLWGAGAGMIVWLAGLKGIPEQLYESASIDGAGPWGKFLHVTLPMLSPYIFFNLIMGIIGTLQTFAQAYIMTGGGPVHSTLFYVYYLFNNAFSYFKMGYACAMAWILFAIILALTLIQVKLAPRWVHYE